MSHVTSHLGARHLRGLDRLGDELVPGDGEMPSFSASGCSRSIDRILDHMPARDVSDIKLLLTLMSLLPPFGVSWFLRLLEAGGRLPGPIGAFVRFARIGVKGLAVTLYYDDPVVLARLGYDVGVYTGDLPDTAPSTTTPS